MQKGVFGIGDRYISTKEAAERFGLSISHVARRARQSNRAGNEWPKKISVSWYAPEEVWKEILTQKKPKKTFHPQNTDQETLYTANKASKILKTYSDKWLSILGQRSMDLGREWPKKMGRSRVAPLSEWEKISKDPELASWKSQKEDKYV